jgi:CHAD domain-containing protein
MAPPAPGRTTLELELPPDELARLLRAPAVLAVRAGRLRTTRASIVWHDTAEAALAGDGLALSHHEGAPQPWRLEGLHGHMGPASPAAPARVLAEAATPEALPIAVPGPLAPIAAFSGRHRVLPLRMAGEAARLGVLDGALRGVAQDLATCRVVLDGETWAVAALAYSLAGSLRLTVPRTSLAAHAMAVARGRAPAPRRLCAPAIPPGLSVDDALVFVTATLGHAILHWGALVPDRSSTEPVHQMRVSVRRLRSALSVFRRAVQDEAGQAPWLDDLADRMRLLAATLGAARDWDVFLAGTGEALARAFGADRRVAGLLAAASRKREAAYAALAAHLGGPAWPRLELTLALLPITRPWHVGAAPKLADMLASPVDAYAARALARRARRVLAPGESLAGLPAPALHDVRKQAKQLRYAAEFFAGLFADRAARRYLKRLEKLQAVLGRVNDTAVAAALTAQLGGGADRAFAAGVVQGFGAGRAARDAGQVRRAWRKFGKAAPFWD